MIDVRIYIERLLILVVTLCIYFHVSVRTLSMHIVFLMSILWFCASLLFSAAVKKLRNKKILASSTIVTLISNDLGLHTIVTGRIVLALHLLYSAHNISLVFTNNE